MLAEKVVATHNLSLTLVDLTFSKVVGNVVLDVVMDIEDHCLVSNSSKLLSFPHSPMFLSVI